MRSPENSPEQEDRRLRQTVQDIVALTALPTTWTGLSPQEIVTSLSDALFDTLSLDLLYLRVGEVGRAGVVEVVRTSTKSGSDAVDSERIRDSLESILSADGEDPPTSIPHPSGSGTLRIAVTQFGVAGEVGVLVIGSDNREFPTERDSLLARVGANEINTVLQHWNADEDGRRLQAAIANSSAEPDETARFLASIITSSNDAIISKTLDGTIRSWNAAAERIFGYTAEQAIGRHISMLIPPERAGEEDRIIAQLRAGQRVEHFNTVRVKSNGERVYVSLTISPIRDAEGRIIGASKIARDITRQKEAEEQLRESEERFVQLGNAISQLAWMAQPDGHIDWYNDRWYEYTGTTFQEMEGWGWKSVHAPEVLPEVVENWQKALESGEPFEMVFPLKGADGVFRPFLTRIIPFRDRDGRIIRWFGTNTDISGVKRTEEELQEARSRLESTLTAGEIGTWEYDTVQNVLRADGNLARMFGVSLDATADSPIESYLSAIHADDREGVQGVIKQAMEFGDDYEVEFRIDGPDQSVRWGIARGRVERDHTGQAIRLPGVVVDITEQKQIEKALQENQERLRLALDSAELGTWNIDPESNHLTSDERFRMIFHACDEPLSYEEAFAAIHPDDRQRIRDAVDAATRLEDPIPYAAEYRVVHPDESIHWVFAKGRGNFEQAAGGSKLTSFDGTVMDITQQRQMQEDLRDLAARLQFVVETSQIGVWDLNLVTGSTRRSAIHDKCFGYDDPLDEWSYEDFLGHVHPEDRAWVNERFQQTIEHDEEWSFECRVIWPNESVHWIEVHGSSYGKADGAQTSILGTVKDITGRKRQENSLRELAARLSEADRRKDEFLATLAHELRNPLAPIRTGLEVMRLSMGNPEMLEEVRRTMERQTQQLITLVDDLLDVSRITKGKLELHKSRVKLSDVVQSAVESSHPLIVEGRHELTVEIPDQEIELNADANRLAQVLSNLLNNSSKYTPEGGHIRLSAERQGNDVNIAVADNGIGIPAEMLEHIFEMFAQIDRPQEKGYTGLGIGLSLVKSLVEMHGGRIDVYSEGVDKGSVFSVRLPIVSESQREDQTPEPTELRANRCVGRKVLVVDDNKAAAKTLSMAVKMLGNEVRSAHNGQEGIAVAELFLPDVILMDIGMPRMNGYEAARHIRRQAWGRDMLLVALTGWGQEQDRERTLEAGFNHHLVKPADPATIAELLADSPQGPAKDK